jgi:hypothetical protein
MNKMLVDSNSKAMEKYLNDLSVVKYQKLINELSDDWKSVGKETL